MNTNRLERINSEIERYRAAQPELETILALYQKVFDIQESASSQEEPAPLISDEDAIAKLAAGEYILKDIPFEPSAELFHQTGLKLGRAFTQTAGEKFPTPALLKLIENHPGGLSGFITAMLSDNLEYLAKFTQNTSFNPETLLFFVTNLVSPFLTAQAKYYQPQVDLLGWDKNTCPFCGSSPRYSCLAKDNGARRLFCSLCHTQWNYRRIKCAYCSNANAEKLRHFYSAIFPYQRVDVCEKCKTYIKTTDERRLGRECLPEVEDAVSIHLDSIAQNEGYQPG